VSKLKVIQQQMDRLPHTENSVTVEDPFARVHLAGLLGSSPNHRSRDNNKAEADKRIEET
jgi:hypothetical protein